MGEAWFSWRGVDSRAMGVIVQTYPPIMLPAERVEELKIPGRAGSLLRTEGEAVYESYLKTVEIANRPHADPRAIAAWLRGSGPLIFGNEPMFVYQARILKEASLGKTFPRAYSGSVSFLCQPCKAAVDPDSPTTLDLTEAEAATSWTRYNPGDVPAKPLITLTGTGTLSVTRSGGSTAYVALAGTGAAGAVIDTDSMMVTDPAGAVLLNTAASVDADGYQGLWLPPGELSTLTWSGTLTAITIDPRWRWL